MTPADRLKELREALELTQDKFADASQRNDPEAKLTRVDVVNVEGHRNKATSHRIRRGIAAAVGASVDDTAAYLDGEITLADFFRRIEEQKAKSSRNQVAQVKRFRDRAEWSTLVEEARRTYKTVPDRYFEEAGTFVDHIQRPIDAIFVGDLARMLYEYAARSGTS